MIPQKPIQYTQSRLALKERQLDDAFLLKEEQVVLHTAQYSLKIQLPDTSYLQLYTPPDRKSIAIEPMNCIANAFNNGIGLKLLKPGEEFNWEVKIEVDIP